MRDFYSKIDIHIHVPEGATPKDGPSAGITMATSIASALTRVPVKSSVAMTGEITLRGRVLPIGGLKEKMIAAHRGGIETILIPKENEKDLAEIPQNVKRNLDIIPVEHMDEVLVNALAVADPSTFLREGDHEFEDIFDTGCSPAEYGLDPRGADAASASTSPAAATQFIGRVAQLVEHLVYTQVVGGSTPSAPTTQPPASHSESFAMAEFPSDPIDPAEFFEGFVPARFAKLALARPTRAREPAPRRAPARRRRRRVALPLTRWQTSTSSRAAARTPRSR